MGLKQQWHYSVGAQAEHPRKNTICGNVQGQKKKKSQKTPTNPKQKIMKPTNKQNPILSHQSPPPKRNPSKELKTEKS